MELTFDWQNEPEGSLLKWLLPEVLAELNDEEKQSQIEKLTESYTKVDLTIAINGIDVPPQKFLDRLDDLMTAYAVDAADTYLDYVADVQSLRDTIDALEGVLYERVKAIAGENEINWTPRSER